MIENPNCNHQSNGSLENNYGAWGGVWVSHLQFFKRLTQNELIVLSHLDAT